MICSSLQWVFVVEKEFLVVLREFQEEEVNFFDMNLGQEFVNFNIFVGYIGLFMDSDNSDNYEFED